ncbi:hypothetical protein [Rhizobium binae]|uniref:hypothetical protein n=1 Tax=Rhizobium binae TaxID=1138190 RepID=UPI001C83F56A|nr:hypothetical protein [Rhizobium binae]MBX4941197.1 hypothetical protein [Rhizobium binae]
MEEKNFASGGLVSASDVQRIIGNDHSPFSPTASCRKSIDRDRIIGNLLDRWEMTPNDLKAEMREHGCGKQLDDLLREVEGRQSTTHY